MRNWAFSLIELMVVIAILGILSAGAVSIYQNYLTRAKMQAVFSVMTNLINQTNHYYSVNGDWPTFQQLGYQDDGNGYILGSGNTSPYIDRIWVGPVGMACGKTVVEIEVDLNINQFNFDPIRDSGIIYMDWIDFNGAFVYSCSSDIGNTATDLTNLLQSCLIKTSPTVHSDDSLNTLEALLCE